MAESEEENDKERENRIDLGGLFDGDKDKSSLFPEDDSSRSTEQGPEVTQTTDALADLESEQETTIDEPPVEPVPIPEPPVRFETEEVYDDKKSEHGLWYNFKRVTRHPGFIIPASIFLSLGLTYKLLLPGFQKKTSESATAVKLDDEQLKKILSSQLEPLRTDMDSKIGSLEKSLNALEGKRLDSSGISSKEIEAFRKQIEEDRINQEGYRRETENTLKLIRKSLKNTAENFEYALEAIKKSQKAKATPAVTPKEGTEPVVPKEKPTEELTDKITDDDPRIKAGLKFVKDQYKDFMPKITEDDSLDTDELAVLTSAYRIVSGFTKKGHPYFGGLDRKKSKTIKTLEKIAGQYLSAAQQIVLDNEKDNNIELKINIDALKNGADKSNSTGWMDLKISLSALSKLDKEAYLTALVNYGSPDSVLKQVKEAETLVYKLLKNAKIFESGKEFTAKVIENAEVKAAWLMMTSPKGAKLTVKNLKYKSFEEAKRGD